MVQTFYIVMFILSILLTMVLVAYFGKHISVYYTLLFSSIILENFGYMQLFSASTTEGALYANQTLYLGACFVPFFSFMCIADLCQVKISKIFQIVCIICSIFIFTGVSTIGINPLYYKSIELVQADGYSYITKEYGPLHILHPIYIVVMITLALIIVINSFRHRKSVSYITSLVLTIIMTATGATYFLERLLHSKIDYMPLTFVALQVGIIILLNRISLYDISGISGSSMTKSMEYGFVICSSKGCLEATDDVARAWFPELNKLFIDYRIKDTSTDFLEQLCKWTRSEDNTEAVLFERDGRIIEAKHSIISTRSNSRIHCISLRDDTNQQQYVRLMQNYNTDLETQVNEKTKKLKRVQNDIIVSMASIVENRDNNTGGHIKRTSDIVRIFVAHLLESGEFGELTLKTAECIIKAAPLHDFGKIAIPDVILNKPGKFTDEEYSEMKKHSEKGAVIVAQILRHSDDIMFKNIAVNVAHYHHEKWNGTGYPSRLSGEAIPFEARVMALADVFDALVSKRVYKESLSYGQAFDIIRDSCGEHFDPRLCEKFLECRPKLEELYDSYTD